jgi:hypothetical protein
VVMVAGMSINIGTPFLLHRGPSLKADAQVDPNLPTPNAAGQDSADGRVLV